jgi:hypothetical protein
MHLLYLLSAYPLWRLLRTSTATSLQSAAYWTFAAWMAWGLHFSGLSFKSVPAAAEEVRYFALCLTGCAGVAVLGARRPHVGAWNAVVLGFLAVMLTPWVEYRLLGTPLTTGIRTWFLGGMLAVSVINYLPTRFALAAVLVGLGCTVEFVTLLDADLQLPPVRDPALYCLLFASWDVLLHRMPPTLTPIDVIWLDFRDRYGLFWGLRIREQFDLAMKNAGVPLRLSWTGLRTLPGTIPPDENQVATALLTLRALRKRFLPDH